jgi:hypothetical protein
MRWTELSLCYEQTRFPASTRRALWKIIWIYVQGRWDREQLDGQCMVAFIMLSSSALREMTQLKVCNANVKELSLNDSIFCQTRKKKAVKSLSDAYFFYLI